MPVLSSRRFKPKGAEAYPIETPLRHLPTKTLRIHPLQRDQIKRVGGGSIQPFRRHAGGIGPVADAQFPEKSGRHVTPCCLDPGDVGRGRHPLQPGVLPDHVLRPAFHSDHGESAGLFQMLRIDPLGDLSDGEAVHIRHIELPDEGRNHLRTPGSWTLHPLCAQRVRPIQHHHLHIVFRGFLHHQSQRADIGVGSASHVLQVIRDHIHSLHHRGGGLSGFSIEGVDLDARLLILGNLAVVVSIFPMPLSGDVFPRTHLAENPVLRPVESHQVHFGSLPESFPGRHPLSIHPRRIGDESHPFSLQWLKTSIRQYIDPQPKSRPLCLLGPGNQTAESENQKCDFGGHRRC